MKVRRVIVLASAIVLICASVAIVFLLSENPSKPKPGIAVAKNISERQPEPTDDYGNDFASVYVAKNKTDKNAETEETIIPCLREYELLIESSGCFSLGKDADWDYTHSVQQDFMGRMVKMYPKPLVRETDDNYYLVYQTDNNTRLFLFYSTIDSQGMF